MARKKGRHNFQRQQENLAGHFEASIEDPGEELERCGLIHQNLTHNAAATAQHEDQGVAG